MAQNAERKQWPVPLYGTDYTIYPTETGHVMREDSGHELKLRDMYQESFVVTAYAGNANVLVGTTIMLSFDEWGNPFFTDEHSEHIEIDDIAQKATLRCVTPVDK
jgi:hypothetical protein